MISVPALPHYSWGGVLALSFIHQINLTYGTHNSLQGLQGYLILIATQAFVPQRQLLHRRLLSPLPVLEVSKNFISTPKILPFSYTNSSNSVPLLRLKILSRYPLNLLKMNNTRLPRITATAGTWFGQDI